MSKLQKWVALRVMNSYLRKNPHATCTELAEHTAIELHHDEWLDDNDHWIWHMALEATQPD